MKAAIYIRVSSEEQGDSWSLGAQLERCQAFADTNGWDVIKVYEDAAFSAKSDQRPALQHPRHTGQEIPAEALAQLSPVRFEHKKCLRPMFF